jgi:tRNA(fMet)-specific endonuclease VapC
MSKPLYLLDTNILVHAARRAATLDAFSRVKGVKMGKNDLWIAASAYCLNAVLLTEDTDFDHLNNVFIQVAGVRKASIVED